MTISVPLLSLPGQPNGVPFPTREWPSGAPEGADTGRLEAELDRAFVSDTGPVAQSLAVVVIQGGRVVAERYGTDTDATTTLISWSMAKSVLQAVVGMLVRDGRADVDEPVLAPEWADPDDPRRAITVSDLLRMRPGLAWVEDYVDDQISDVIEMLFGSGQADMAAYAAALPLEVPPGERWLYSSGTSNLLARFVGQRLGPGRAAFEAYLQEELFDPLGMSSATAKFDDAGTFVGSSYVYATARDFARFGLLYLRDGVWDGRRILPEGWVDRARTLQAVDPERIDGYGDHWWVFPCPWGSFRASGYEGQSIVVVPGLDLVVVRSGKTPDVEGTDPVFEHLAELVACFTG